MNGVDCYSNDRCRREDPEKFKKVAFTQMPTSGIIVLLLVGAVLCGCLSCCFYIAGGIKGAYDDLASITMAATIPPSVIGPSSMTGPPETTPENVSSNMESRQEANEESYVSGKDEEAHIELSNQNGGSANGEYESLFIDGNDVDDSGLSNEDPTPETPLLSGQYPYGDASALSEPTHMGRICRVCTVCYVLSISAVATFIVVCMYMFPVKPVYNVCNDSVVRLITVWHLCGGCRILSSFCSFLSNLSSR